jgi:uncharacterized membrane protein
MHVRVTTGWLKFLIGWAAVFAFRLILLPVRPPNVEPVLATLMPFSKRYGALASFVFAALSIVLYDAVTSGFGSWTWSAALTYGGVAVGSYFYFRKREATRTNFVIYGVIGTLAYDAVTMLMGPLLGHQSFALALAGQIPFTALHLAGTVTFALTLSPLIYRWVVQNEALEFSLARFRRTAAR